MLGLLTAAEGPALPSLAQNTSSTLDQISLIFIFGSLGYLLGSLLSGQAYDRIPGQRVIAVTLFIISLCTSFVPSIHNLSLLLIDLFLLGLAKGALDVGCNTLLLRVHGKKAGPFMNGLHFFFGLGAACAPLILASVLHLSGGIQGMFWLFALLSLPMAVWLWNLPEPSTGVNQKENSRTPFPVIPVALLVFAFLLYVGAEIGFGSWIYTYAISLRLGSSITSAFLTSAFWGAFTLGRLIGIWVSAQARAATILFVDLTCSLVHGFHLPNHVTAGRRTNTRQRCHNGLVAGRGQPWGNDATVGDRAGVRQIGASSHARVGIFRANGKFGDRRPLCTSSGHFT